MNVYYAHVVKLEMVTAKSGRKTSSRYLFYLFYLFIHLSDNYNW